LVLAHRLDAARYPSGQLDYKNAPDLLKDKMVMFQHKYYVPLALAINFGIPIGLGYLVGDVAGVVLLAGYCVWS